MQILHVIPGLTVERGGPSTCVAALSRHQAKMGHDVTVLTTDQGLRHGERATELAPAVRLLRMSVLGPDRLAYAPRFKKALRQLLAGTDLIHAHSIFTYPIHSTLWEALAAGIPLVLRPCGQLTDYSLGRGGTRKRAYLSFWGDLIRRSCTAWHYTSSQEAASSWPGPRSPSFVVPNGIEPEEFPLDRVEARRRLERTWPILGDAPFVLFLGRLHAKKRLDFLLQTFLMAAPSCCKLVIAGPDEQGLWPCLQRRFQLERHARRVVRVNPVTREDKEALLAAASLFALPSEHENFGIAALEALAAGTPVLLSPHVDLAGQAIPPAAGFQEPLELNIWVERLAALLANPEELARGGMQGRDWALKHFAWERIAADLSAWYGWVQNGCPQAAVPCEACS